MLYFVDTNFTCGGNSESSLLTIGVVSEDGRNSFYGEVKDYTHVHDSPDVDSIINEIKPTLKGGELLVSDGSHIRITSKYSKIAYAFVNWILHLLKTKEDIHPEYPSILFVSKVSHYDATLVYALIGHGLNLLYTDTNGKETSRFISSHVHPIFVDLSTTLYQKGLQANLSPERSANVVYRSSIIDMLDGGYLQNDDTYITEDKLREYEKNHNSFWIACLIRLLYMNIMKDKWPMILFPDARKVIEYWDKTPSSILQEISFTNILDLFSNEIKIFPNLPDLSMDNKQKGGKEK